MHGGMSYSFTGIYLFTIKLQGNYFVSTMNLPDINLIDIKTKYTEVASGSLRLAIIRGTFNKDCHLVFSFVMMY